MVLCTTRLTSSGSSPAPWLCAAPWVASKAIAWSMGPSPNKVAKRYATTPAARPTNMPRTSRARADISAAPSRSVAGEAEQVPSVVDELVHRRAGDERGDALLGADEVEQHDGHEGA